MGTLGGQEIVVIFILALLLFGPKKLPELGRTIGKAITEFRRAQSELKATFDREMRNLERETDLSSMQKEIVSADYTADSYNYDYSSYDSNYYTESVESTATTTTTPGASATEGTGTSATLQVEAAAGTIAAGHLDLSHTESAHANNPYEEHANGFPDEFPPSAEPSYTAGFEHVPAPAEKTVNS